MEIIIMLTPHILKMPDVTALDMIALDVGTVTQPRLPSLTVAGPNATEPVAPRPNVNAPAPTPTPAQPAFGTPVQPTSSGAAEPFECTGNRSGSVFRFNFISVGPVCDGVAEGNAGEYHVVNGVDISGAELTLTFDPGSISISQIVDGGFLSRDGQLIAVVQQIESDAGKAHVRIERPPNAAALAGTGNLITLTIVPKDKKGDSLLRVTDIKLRDSAQIVRTGPRWRPELRFNDWNMTRKRTSGFTLVELIVTVALVSILVGLALPLARNTIQREKEKELRQALATCARQSTAIRPRQTGDRLWQTQWQMVIHRIWKRLPMASIFTAVGKKIYFLRAVPIDPMSECRCNTDWDLRSDQDDPTAGSWGGQDVFDVHTKSSGTAMDGTKYKDW